MKKIIPILILMVLSACASIERLAIPDNRLKNEYFLLQGDRDDLDHTLWNNFLKTYTVEDSQGVVRVNYGAVSADDVDLLDRYIISMGRIVPSALTRDAQLAFWANLYNAVTIRTILNHYPVNSIRDIKSNLLDLGPWDEKRVFVNGTHLSLHDIEHGIVRAKWKNEPKIHYLLNCAAVGCPNLSTKAFTAHNVHAHMNEAAKHYVNNVRGLSVHPDGRVGVSKIYSWYLNDFGGSQNSVLNHIRKYGVDNTQTLIQGKSYIDHYYYDWGLNDTKTSDKIIIPSFPVISEMNK